MTVYSTWGDPWKNWGITLMGLLHKNTASQPGNDRLDYKLCKKRHPKYLNSAWKNMLGILLLTQFCPSQLTIEKNMEIK